MFLWGFCWQFCFYWRCCDVGDIGGIGDTGDCGGDECVLVQAATNLLHDFETSGIFLPPELRDTVVSLLEQIQVKRMEFEAAMGRVGPHPVTINKDDL